VSTRTLSKQVLVGPALVALGYDQPIEEVIDERHRAGESYDQIALWLAMRADVVVSRETIRRWHQAWLEQQPPQEAS